MLFMHQFPTINDFYALKLLFVATLFKMELNLPAQQYPLCEFFNESEARCLNIPLTNPCAFIGNFLPS